MRALLIGLVAAGLALAGPAAAETPANTFVMAKNIDDIISLDPAEVYELSSSETIQNVYERLIGREPENTAELVPTAAESWSVSDDGRTFTFVMRPGLTFHSGNPVRAQDAAFSLQRVIKLNLTPSYLFTQLGWTPENVEEMVKAVDDKTLQITVSENFAPTFVLNLMGTITGSIVDEKVVMEHEVDGDLGHEWLKANSAGSGSFSLRSWKPNESYVLEAFPDARRGAPTIERVIVQHIPEASAQRLVLEQGDIDMARNLTGDQIAAIAGNPEIVVEAAPKATIYYLGLNQKVEALANPKVQEALRYLVDYQGMADSFLKGRFQVHQAFWSSGFAESLDDTPYALDVEKAKALLAEAGYPDGFSITLDTPNEAPFDDIAESLQSNFAQAGITLEILPAETGQVLTKYRARTHETVIMYWGPDYLDPHSNAGSFAYNRDNSDGASEKPVAWRNTWDIPELTEETLTALREPDADKRREMYLELQGKLQQSGPFVIMFQETEQNARRANVTGFVSGPNADLVFFDRVTKAAD